MTLQFSCQPDLSKCCEAHELFVLPFWEGVEPAADLSKWQEWIKAPLASGDFKAKKGETLLIYGESGRFLFLGLGKKGDVESEVLRRAYSSAVRRAQEKKIRSMQILFPKIDSLPRQEAIRSVAEGIFLTNYAFTHLKGLTLKDNPSVLLEKVIFYGLEPTDQEALKKWYTISSGVHFARELVNANADDVTPLTLAETAKNLEKQSRHLKLTVLDKKQIEKEKMGLFLAVNRGSSTEPRLIVLSYQGNPKSKDHVVLVGKGITYDTGGLSLKPTDSMLGMKCDMSGGATVLAAVHVAETLGLKVNVTAIVPATENSIDSDSYKIGDVYRAMNGKTVEITNTDAEGRLVLADAMAYAAKHLKPSILIDVASLTGAIVIALGEDLSGLFCNNEALSQDLMTASDGVGERLWRMPLVADYQEMLKSDYADMVNSAGRTASSITAALFLQEFCSSLPWAHLDIAGSCFPTKPKHYHTTKGTGFGVRLLVDFLERRST